MKTLINSFSFLLIFTSVSFPQFYADSILADEVVEFFNIADEKTVNFSMYDRPKIEFTDDELEHLLGLYYKCYSIYLVCFNDYMAEEHKKWEKRMVDSNKKSTELRPWMKIYALIDKLKEKYGSQLIAITGTPSILRCKYERLDFSQYSLDASTHFRVDNFIFVVEEVLKGEKYFHSGDTISVDMIPNVESPAPSFHVDESYLIPLTTLLGHQDDGFKTIFVCLREQEIGWEMGKPPKTFPIENEIIKNCEYFGIQDTSWTDFKKYFKETYLIFD